MMKLNLSVCSARKNLWLALTLVAAWVGSGVARAATLTWDADAAVAGAQDGSGIWSTNANWWTGSANATFNGAVPDAAVFGSLNGAAGTVTLGSSMVSSNITFNAAGAGNYTIAGGSETLALTNRTIAANSSATISAKIAGATLTVAHSVGNNPIGTLTLSGANSFNGLVIGPDNALVNGGSPNTTAAVRLTSGAAAGTGTISFNGQGNATSPRLELTGGITVTNTLTLAGRNNVGPAILSFSGANILAGPFTLGAGGSQYPVVVEGASTLTLAGTTTVQTSGSRHLVFGGSGNGTVSGTIAGGAAGVTTILLSKGGTGNWTFAGPNTIAASFAVARGTLTLDYTANNNAKLSAALPLYLSGGTLNLNGGAFTETVSSNILTASGSTIARASGSSVLRLNSIVRRPGGTLNFGAASVAQTTTPNVNGILGGYATVAGADWAVNSTGGANGPVTAYTAYTDMAASGSTLANNAAANIRLQTAGSGGNISLGAPATTVNTLLQNTTTAATIDTTGSTLRLGAVGGILIPSGSQSLTIGTSTDAGTLTAGGADNTPGELILINNSANNFVVNSTIADNGSGAVALTKSGSGSVTLNGNNSHTGTNYIVGGTLNVSSGANLGSGTVVINNGTLRATTGFTISSVVLLGPSAGYGNGSVNVAANETLTFAGVVGNNILGGPGAYIAGSLTKTGPGTLVLQSANTYTFGTIINEGVVSISQDSNLGNFDNPLGSGSFACYRSDNIVLNGGTLELNGTFTLSANRGMRLGPVNGAGSGTVQVTDGNSVTFAGQISDNWAGNGSFTKTGGGTLALSGSVSDYTGNTTIAAGTLRLDNARALPNGPGKGNLIVNAGATLDVTANAFLNGVTGAGTIDNSSSNPVRLTLGNNDAGGTFTGIIQNSGGGAITLVKVGTGTLTLSGGSSTFSGSTIVNAGTLALSGSASLSGTTNITVAAGATLNVSGASGGALTLDGGQSLVLNGTLQGGLIAGSTTLTPGGNAAAGTMTINGDLTLNGGGTLSYDLASSTTPGSSINDLIVVGGNVNLSPSTTVAVNFLSGLPSAGTYTLIQAGGTINGDVSSLIAPNIGARYSVSFAINNSSSPRTVTMTITGNPQALVWTGANGSDWDLASLNWTNTATMTPDFFSQGDNVTFNNNAANTAVNLPAPVLPSSVTVNASVDYSFNGGSSGYISGVAGLTKSGSGTLTIEAQNDYSGVTRIEGGTLQIGNGGSFGQLGSGPTTNNASLIFNLSDNLTYTNLITGSGVITNAGNAGTVLLSGSVSGNQTITLTGAGMFALAGSNSYSGLTLAEAGSLRPRHTAALGSTNVGTIVRDGAQLYIDANVNIGEEPLTLAGAANGGALRKGGGGSSMFGGPITLVADTTFHNDGNASLNLTNAAGVNGNGFNLTLTGDGGSSGTINGPVSLGGMTLTKSGVGSWTLAPTNNYTGKTFITGGTLFAGGAASFGPTPASWTADFINLSGGSLGVTTNFGVTQFAFADGRRGIAFAADGGFNVGPGATLIVSNEMSGTANLIKSGSGTLVLIGTHSLAGILYLDRGADGNNNDGITRITGATAIQNFSELRMRNTSVNTAGGATLQLDGSAGNFTVTQPIALSCRQDAATNATVHNVAGSNTLSGGITLTAGGNSVNVQTDAGSTLAISGAVQFNDAPLTLRNLRFMGDGNAVVTGDILLSANGVTPLALIKTGAGTLTLAGANTYSDNTTVSNGVLLLAGSISSTGRVTVAGGTLSGTGTINAPVIVGASGNLSPGFGASSVGTLSVNSDLTLSGTTTIDINKAAGTRDQVTGLTSVTYGGVLVVNNLGGSYSVGDTFQVFNAALHSGSFASVTGSAGPGRAFSFNPLNGMVTVVTGMATSPTNITFSVTSSNLALSWPETHVGWVLQAQTNLLSVGLSTNWMDVANSSTTNQIVLPITRNDPTVFFRLRLP